MVHSVYTKNPKLTRDRAVLEKIFFRLDFAAKIDYNITVLYGISRCVGMADEGDSKSLVLITRVGSTPTTGIKKRTSPACLGEFSFLSAACDHDLVVCIGRDRHAGLHHFQPVHEKIVEKYRMMTLPIS